MRYSAFAIAREALRGNRHWAPVWRDPEPKPCYDVVIIGGGGHGLATAYYLAKEHGIANVAVLWLSRLRQCRPQHHDRALELPPVRQCALLRMVDEALAGAGAEHQLQRHGEPEGRAEPLPFGRPARRLRPARQFHAAARSRRGASGPGAGAQDGALPRFRERALPDPGRAFAASRRHGAP